MQPPNKSPHSDGKGPFPLGDIPFDSADFLEVPTPKRLTEPEYGPDVAPIVTVEQPEAVTEQAHKDDSDNYGQNKGFGQADPYP